jgi:hypothetical protein
MALAITDATEGSSFEINKTSNGRFWQHGVDLVEW